MWMQTLTAERHLTPATIRGYQTDLRLFSEYLTDGRDGWAVDCQKAFGSLPVATCHEWNTVTPMALQDRPDLLGSFAVPAEVGGYR